MIVVETDCDRCKHFHKELRNGCLVCCDAFPNGIPGEVIWGKKTEGTLCNDSFGFEEKK